MYSSEPFEHSVSNPVPPVPPAVDSEEWRAEVASRVQSYRARQKNRRAEQQSLGFPPHEANTRCAEDSIEVVIEPSPATTAVLSESPADSPSEDKENSRESLPQRKPSQGAQGACDTNYYRRLNAHALEQSAQSSPAIATLLSEELADPILEEVAECRPEVLTAPLNERSVEWATTAREIQVDLDLHAPAAGDARLDRYCIHGNAEANDCATAPTPQSSRAQLDEVAPLPPAPAPHATSGSPASAQLASWGGNLLVFPRLLVEPPLWAPPSRDELADPVSRPRILEVPEEIMPAMQGSLFPEIRLDLEEPEPSPRRKPEIEVQLPVAPLSTRLKAAVADLAVVASGGGLFAAIANRAMPELAAKPFSIMVTAVTVVLWAAYHQMFLLYAGSTVGMRMLGLRLSTFDGRTPRRGQRRSRARYILISCASAALGFLWALVDEDRLCWHDRVSQTFPTMD